MIHYFRKGSGDLVHRWGRRLGVAIGIFAGLIVAVIFILPWTSAAADRLELIALDTFFRLRSPIVESDEIVHIDIDDNSIEALGDYPWRRTKHADLINTLSYLGVQLIVFDIEFKKPSVYDYNEESGLYLTGGTDDESLARAIARSGNVILAYSFDISNPFTERVNVLLPELRRVIAGNAAIDEREAAAAVGADPSIFEGDFVKIRDSVIEQIVRERLRDNPGISFKELSASLIPGFDRRLHKSILNVIQKRYVQILSTGMIQRRLSAGVTGADVSPVAVNSLMAPMIEFCRSAAGFGCVNAIEDADGVLRRVPLYMIHGDRTYLPLALETYLKREELRGRIVDVDIRPGDAVILRSRGKDDKDVETNVIPIDGRGMALVNWAGHPPAIKPFRRVPFSRVLQFHEQRYLQRIKNIREVIEKLFREPKEKDAVLRSMLAVETGDVRSGMMELERIERRCLEILDDEIRGRQQRLEEMLKPLSTTNNLPPSILRLKSDIQSMVGGRKILADMMDDRLLENELRGQLAGKICFVGSASTASGDLHPMPLHGSNPGVDIHSSVLNMILTDQSLILPSAMAKCATILLCSILIALAASYYTPAKSVVFTLLLFVVAAAVLQLGFEVFRVQISAAGPLTGGVSSLLSVTVFREFTERRAKRRMQKELEGRTSKSLVTEIIKDPDRIKRPRKFVATAFFSDIKGFTPVSETMAPEQLVHFLNRYHDAMSRIMLRHDAYLDKYLGDGIMAVFGVPVWKEDHAVRACAAALECIAALEDLNRAYAADKLPKVEARVGVNSGDMIAGSVGSLERHDYTVIGDAVNLAARLEVANKFYGTRIAIGEATADLVKDHFELRELDTIRVTGKRVAVRIYELLSRKGELGPEQAKMIDAYREGLTRFRARDWDNAFSAFETARRVNGEDVPTKVYIKRCADFSLSPPAEDWDGVFDVLTK